MEGVACDNCNQKHDALSKTMMHKLPNYLFIHLNRIVFDMDTYGNKKLNSRVEFPNVLNVKPYTVNDVLKQEPEIMNKLKQQKKGTASSQGSG